MSFLTINIIKRGFATTPAKEYVIKNVTVIGGGLMGSGIAQVSYFTVTMLKMARSMPIET